jgi:hypothetical protein
MTFTNGRGETADNTSSNTTAPTLQSLTRVRATYSSKER